MLTLLTKCSKCLKKGDEWHTAVPNEDFGMSKNMCSRSFVSTFHTLNYSIWAKSSSKCLQNFWGTYFSTFQNLRLGSIKLLQKIIASHKNYYPCNHLAKSLQKFIASRKTQHIACYSLCIVLQSFYNRT
jgi:hypothetical protein